MSESVHRSTLRGRTLLNTRPVHQLQPLTSALNAAGAAVLEVPCSVIMPLLWEPELDQWMHPRSLEDWLVFTSANGIDAVFGSPAVEVGRIDHLRKLPLAVIGEQTAEAARRQRLEPRFISAEQHSPGFAAELARKFGELPQPPRLFLLRGSSADDRLPTLLREAKLVVSSIPVYEARIADVSHERLSELAVALEASAVGTAKGLAADHLRGQPLDMTIFMSGEAVRNTLLQLERYDPGSDRPLIRLLHQVPVAAIGPETAGVARQLGFEVAVCPSKPSTAQLVAAIERYFAAAAPQRGR